MILRSTPSVHGLPRVNCRDREREAEELGFVAAWHWRNCQSGRTKRYSYHLA
jgi:hypothetical protein